MNRLAAITSFSLAAVLLFVQCAKEPTFELATAKASLDAATIARADKYALVEFSALQDTFNAAQAEFALQKAKLPFSRIYNVTNSRLAFVIANAPKITAKAVDEQLRSRDEATNILAKVTLSLADVKDVVIKVPRKGKEAKALLDSAKVTLIAFDTAFSALQKMNDKREFVAVFDTGAPLFAKIEAFKAILTAYLEKVEEKARKQEGK